MKILQPAQCAPQRAPQRAVGILPAGVQQGNPSSGFVICYLGDPNMPLQLHERHDRDAKRYFEIVAPQDATLFSDESSAMRAASRFNVGSYSINPFPLNS
jgi:hypothetical protein